MSDPLEQLNNTNAACKTLQARVLFPASKEIPDKNMHVFSCTLVSQSGLYTKGEAVLFGTPQQRGKAVAALTNKYKKDGVHEFTKMKMLVKKPQFQSCPHAFVLNLGHKPLVSKLITGAAANTLPSEAEPPMTTFDLLELETSQLVDVTAVATNVSGSTSATEGKSNVKVTLSNASGIEIPLIFRDDTRHLAGDIDTFKPLYVYNVYLVVESSGGRHLTARKERLAVPASGARPIAHALGDSNVQALPAEKKEYLSKWESGGNWEDGAACSAHTGILECATHFKRALSHTLFEITGALVSLQSADAADLLTKDKTRIWAKVDITDFANTVTADMPESVALTLTDTKDKDEFLQQATSGSLAFTRARLRVRFDTPAGSTVPSLSVVAAKCRHFDVPEPNLVPPSDARLVPVQLTWASQSPTGLIGIALPGEGGRRLASGILALIVGAKEPKTEPAADGFAIRNFVTEACGDHMDQQWETVTSAPASRLAYYALPRKEVALVRVTHIDVAAKVLTVADMWKQPTGMSFDPWTAEMQATMQLLKTPPHTLKRKLDDFDPDLQGIAAKRMHTTFGEPATPM
ncbi:unnamed protein product [Prorocentrum cordatum]|uniref:Uncharacterized protein n=1 Tax=Prorocentrum cordatum TaxID=2364126 RepID=A0ABN9T377_9DINO|nr:unnamed protein product [Polarella glacialis]